MIYFLFNPLANNGAANEAKVEVNKKISEKFGELVEKSVIDLDTDSFLKTLKEDDRVIMFGGDGTLMHFANNVYGKKLPCSFYLYKGGTGNDFLNDVKDDIKDDMVELNKYVENLPTIYVNGSEYKYLNGIGYGIDGFVCEIAEKMKAQGKKKISYAGLSVKNLLHGYKCPSAKVTVDGVTKEYKKVWLASCMNGRYYGGGMDIAPNQDRFSDVVSSCIFHDSGKLKTLMIFPKIFKGEHIKHTKYFEIRTGHDVTVEFSRPMALQIDGEVVYNVTSYRVVKK